MEPQVTAGATQRPAAAAPAAAPQADAVTVPSPVTGEGQGGGSEGRTRLSAAVRALIDEHRISDTELSRIEGSGIGGRISKKDVEDYVAKRTQRAAANGEQRQEASPASASQAPTPGTTIPLSPMRRAVAHNNGKSKQTSPHHLERAPGGMANRVRCP